MAPLPQQLLHGLRLVLIHLTPQGVHGNFHGFLLALSQKQLYNDKLRK
jgi:hypothetical protein